jgi:hypothetical protein
LSKKILIVEPLNIFMSSIYNSFRREQIFMQAETQGLVTHGMQGFDYERARRDLLVPDVFDVLGKPAAKESLPRELQ